MSSKRTLALLNCCTERMKTLLALLLVIAVGVILVLSERCDSYADCRTTICGGNASHVTCQHDVCTCVTHLACNTVADCTNMARCHDHDEHHHCVDGMCLCLDDDIIDD